MNKRIENNMNNKEKIIKDNFHSENQYKMLKN